jgi:peptide-methionine (S)-S-oxide reductase
VLVVISRLCFGAYKNFKTPVVLDTQTGRANGCTKSTKTDYDGYECVKTTFDSKVVSIEDLIHRFNEIIDP